MKLPAYTVPGWGNMVAIDTEGELIRPGVQAPRMVLFQYQGFRDSGMIHAAREPDAVESMVRSFLSPGDTTIIQGHNIAFDMACLCANFPRLMPLIFDGYESGRIRCTIIREKLMDIAERGKTKPRYDLETVASHYREVPPVNKQSSWRLRFGEFINTPLEQFPSEAVDYARGDVNAQFALYIAQLRRAESIDEVNPAMVRLPSIPGGYVEGGVLTDQCRQSAAAFWIYLMQSWGVHTDTRAVRAYYDQKKEQLESYRDELVQSGLVRKDGTRNIKLAQARMIQVCNDQGIEVRLTDGGKSGNKQPELSEDAISLVNDPLLEKYSSYGSTDQLLSRIERLFKGDVTPIQSSYDTLLVTGRTSCSQGDTKANPPKSYGFQLQNPPTESGVRECFVPRPGRWFLFADWTGVELRTWASVCLWALGHSRLAEVLNAGRDPHNDLGARLRGQPPEWAEQVMAGAFGAEFRKHFKDHERQTSKIGNFGFPGGMGIDALILQARKLYGVILTREQVIELKRAWLENWPEAPEYFRWVNSILNGGDHATIRQFKSSRYRGMAGYCQIANTFFQGLASDVAKDAGFQLARSCYVRPDSYLYGSRMWNFAHDEFMLEIPANPYQATMIAREVESTMVGASTRWMPELEPAHKVSISVTAHRWSKAAEPRYATSGQFRGCLIPWDWNSQEG